MMIKEYTQGDSRMSDVNYSLGQWLPQVIEIAQDAGRAIVEIYNRDFNIEHKDDKSPLTEADMAAHHIIVDSLKDMTPTIPVLSEESADIPYAERSTWQRYWLVDPLDGTREFIKRNGEFTVNIALIDGGQAIMGVIVVPVTGQCFYACRGQGAFRQELGGTPQAIHTRRLDPNNKCIVGSRSHAGERLKIFLANVGDHDLESMGSSLKSCLVAEGKADIYPRLGLTSEWDTAAAQAIVEEAGGIITTLDMQPLLYNTKDSLLNPEFLVIGDPDFDWARYLPE
jgi:3'(2'), 5'-bisphosphate nucleotidase